jgi:hypothetical protein
MIRNRREVDVRIEVLEVQFVAEIDMCNDRGELKEDMIYIPSKSDHN